MALPVTTEGSSKSLVTATLVGFVAIVLWGFSPLTPLLLKGIPPLQLTATMFGIASIVTFVAFWKKRDKVAASIRMPITLLLVNLAGIFGFNYLYILALRSAPAVEVVLIVNLWPIVMMLMSIASERRKLEWQHILGAAIGLAGVYVCVTKGKSIALDWQHLGGYLAACGCALLWPIYSLVNRKADSEQTSYAIPWLCLISAFLGLILHVVGEATVSPTNWQWAYLIFAGAGATGLSFIFWDYGVKHGDIRLLSNISYGEPLIGLLVLIVFGFAQYTPLVALSALLIVAGAALSSLTLRKSPKSP